MILTLEITGQPAANLGARRRKEFGSTGGVIGRLPDNDWVLPGEYISGHHARIQCRGGQFFVEDMSTNGVFVNSPENRLQRGRPYPLKSGDRLYIDMYEIQVAVTEEERASGPYVQPESASGARKAPYIPDDPFAIEDDAPRAPSPRGAPPAAQRSAGIGLPDPFGGLEEPVLAGGEADPLKLLGLEERKAPAAARPPRASELASGSRLSDSYRPPPVRESEILDRPFIPEDALEESAAPGGPPAEDLIPDDYDPLAPETSANVSPASRSTRPPPRPQARTPAPTPAPTPARPAPAQATAEATAPIARPPPLRPAPEPGPAGARGAAPARTPSVASSQVGFHAEPRQSPAPLPTPAEAVPRDQPTPPAAPPRVPDTGARAGNFDFNAFLEGAGVRGVEISPELARDFGAILRVVIGGLMDVLRARERIKDEFRMRVTTFKAADNNPLKFSANVEDALHNLLVKRNPAYLDAVEAFEDAFSDVRYHQMAMLAGVRVAYEAMLAQFDPERLQTEFDRQGKKGFLGAQGRRYWDLYCELFRDRVRDADSCFRELFGDEFAKAYEEQLARLRAAQGHNEK